MTSSRPPSGSTAGPATASPTTPPFDPAGAQQVADERGLRHPIAPRYWKARNLTVASLVRVLMSFLGMVVASFLVLILSVLFIQNVLGLAESEWSILPARVVTCAAGLAVAWALRRYFEGDRTGFMPWQWQGGRALVALLIGQVVATVAIGATNLAMVGAGVVTAGGLQVSVNQLLLAIPNVIAVSYIMQGIPEEMVWRGYGQTVLAERLNPWLAGAATGVGFGLMHLVSQGSGDSVWSKMFYILSSIALGLACAGLRQLTGSVWAAAGFHGGFHVTNKIMQAWFTGGEPAAAFNAQGAAMFFVFLACWFIGRRDRTDRAVDTRTDRVVDTPTPATGPAPAAR